MLICIFKVKGTKKELLIEEDDHCIPLSELSSVVKRLKPFDKKCIYVPVKERERAEKFVNKIKENIKGGWLKVNRCERFGLLATLVLKVVKSSRKRKYTYPDDTIIL
jgi:hypothetical protein